MTSSSEAHELTCRETIARRVAMVNAFFDNARRRGETLEEWEERVGAETWNAQRRELHDEGVSV